VGEDRCREGRGSVQGWAFAVRRCDGDRCDGVARLGPGWRATVIGAMGWLGLARLARLAGHGLGERETEQRERTEQRSVEGTGVARGGWGGWGGW
jgi:hypothetical protein